MKTKEEIEKLFQSYLMTAEMHKRNAKDDLWRLAIARAKVCELILEQDYQTMMKERKKRNHDKRSEMMKKRHAKYGI